MTAFKKPAHRFPVGFFPYISTFFFAHLAALIQISMASIA